MRNSTSPVEATTNQRPFFLSQILHKYLSDVACSDSSVCSSCPSHLFPLYVPTFLLNRIEISSKITSQASSFFTLCSVPWFLLCSTARLNHSRKGWRWWIVEAQLLRERSKFKHGQEKQNWYGAMNHLDHTPSLFLLLQLQRCSFLSPPQMLAAVQFHFVMLLSIYVLHHLFSSAILNDCSRMLFLVGL